MNLLLLNLTVVSFTVVSEYEYPAEQCNDAQKGVREIRAEAPDIVNREYSALRRYVIKADLRSAYMSTIYINDIALYL